MRIALISDPHITWEKPVGRLDDVFKTTLSKMNYVLNYCEENELPLLVAGDTTDKPRSWVSIQKIIETFRSYAYDVGVYVVYGQHDAYMRGSRGSTILGVLIKTGLVMFLGKVPRILNLDYKGVKTKANNIFVYGCSWEDEVPKPRQRAKGDKNILVIHASISHHEDHTTEADLFLRDHKEYDLVLCGDIHKAFIHKLGERSIVNTGPMFRGEATREMFKHQPHFLVWDSETNEFETVGIPHLPANQVLTRDHIEKSKEVDEILETFISAVKKGIRHKEKRVSKTFRTYARDNKIERRIEDIIYDLLLKVEDAGGKYD